MLEEKVYVVKGVTELQKDPHVFMGA